MNKNRKEADKRYRLKNKEKIKAYDRQYRQDNKEARQELNNLYRKTPSGKKSIRITKWKSIGIIDEDLGAVYDYYILETNCMICNKKYKGSEDRCLDHHHLEGYIRYICCQYCNLHVVG